MSDQVRHVHAPHPVWTGLVCLAVGCFSPNGSEDTGGASSEAGASTSSVTTDSIPTTGAGSTSTTGDGGPTSMPAATDTSMGDDSPGDSSTGEPPADCPGQPFISTEELLQTIRDDLASMQAENQSFTRYLTLVHLHNAGVCDPEIEVERRALSKLLNSLSRASLLVAPEPVDDGLVFRIDLRDYTWSWMDEMPPKLSEPSFYYPEDSELSKVYDSRWDLLVDQNPYRLRYVGGLADEIEVLAGTKDVILRADALVDAAARPPLYYDALGMPMSLDQLEAVLLLDLDAALAMERSQDSDHVARAALRKSNVTGTVRALERQDFPDNPARAIWQTFDFVPRNTDVFEQPFDFTADGSEVLFNLPNGLHAYVSLDDAGNRRQSVPPDIFGDPAQPDGVARVGISCIGCHVAGVHAAEDDLRHEIDMGMNEGLYTQDVLLEILRVYPVRGHFSLLLDTDALRFADALETLGLSPDDPEPVLASFKAFAGDVDLRRAAAEFERTEPELLAEFGKLHLDYTVLLEPGGTMSRADFTARFAASACALELGETRCCGGADPPPPSCGG